MNRKKLAIIGFGTVGSGVYEELHRNRTKLELMIGNEFEVSIILVKDLQKTRQVSNDTMITDNFNDILATADLDVVVEATPDDKTAYPYVKSLLMEGISVVTANKELIAKRGEELLEIARFSGCRLFFEAAVAGGIPILSAVRHTLKTNQIERLEAIVNGTSNFILTKMRKEGTAFFEALEEAQEKGYAEAVPDKDVDGWDAFYKATILSHWIYGTAPQWSHDRPEGIRDVDVRDLLIAEELGARIKHVASLLRTSSGIIASVQPKCVVESHPLYAVEGVDNGVHVEGSIVGSLLFQGAGAGKYPTASAIIEDVVNLWVGACEQDPLLEFSKEKDAIEQQTYEHKNTTTSQVKIAESVEKIETFLVTGTKHLTNIAIINDLVPLTNVINVNGREGILVTSTEKDIETYRATLQEADAINVYPICGQITDLVSQQLDLKYSAS